MISRTFAVMGSAFKIFAAQYIGVADAFVTATKRRLKRRLVHFFMRKSYYKNGDLKIGGVIFNLRAVSYVHIQNE